ncbi:MAG: hypothetical protein OER88_01945 [Planctomycetota bacterium]|nr:hypothetical protein [Planctomycetota bacterium]
MKIKRTRRGARIVEGDVVLSEILAQPGPTHTLFDVLAAGVAALAPGPAVALLGFAGGGIVAPLRAMGHDAPLAAVDLSLQGAALFRELSGAWAGDVSLDEADAVDWLRGSRRRFDMIVEDLSVPSPIGTVKPYASFDPLPGLMRRRLRTGGVVLVNVLPLPGTSWDSMMMRLAMPFERALVVKLDEYENRFLIASDALPDTGAASRAIRRALRAICSYQEKKIRVRTLFR